MPAEYVPNLSESTVRNSEHQNGRCADGRDDKERLFDTNQQAAGIENSSDPEEASQCAKDLLTMRYRAWLYTEPAQEAVFSHSRCVDL